MKHICFFFLIATQSSLYTIALKFLFKNNVNSQLWKSSTVLRPLYAVSPPPPSISKMPKKPKAGYKLPDLSQSQFPDCSEGYDLLAIGSGPAGESAAVRAGRISYCIYMI